MPVLTFSTLGVDAALGSNERAILFVVAHSGFFFFNFMNVCITTLFFVFGNLWNNPLSKLAFLACFFQMCSCICSIHRYNINDEFGFFAHVSVALGLLAYCPFNIAYTYLVFSHNKDAFLDHFACGFTLRYLYVVVGMSLAAAAGCFLIGYAEWEQHDFTWFRSFIFWSTMYQIIAISVGLWNFCNHNIKLGDSSVLSRKSTIKVFAVCIGLNVLALALAGSGIPVLQYPATGLTFSVLSVVMAFAGDMDFMALPDQKPAKVVEDLRQKEDSPLLPTTHVQMATPMDNRNSLVSLFYEVVASLLPRAEEASYDDSGVELLPRVHTNVYVAPSADENPEHLQRAEIIGNARPTPPQNV